MILALPLLTGVLAFGPPGEVLTPTQPQVGEPAIAPAVIESERAGPEPLPTEPPEPTPVVEPEPDPDPGLPSWDEGPSQPPDPGPSQPAGPSEGPSEATIADWTTPVDPVFADDPVDPGPRKGWGLIGAAGGVFGGMVLTQLITGLACDDVYCGTRGWPWRGMGLATVAFAGGGGWVIGKRQAWEQGQAGEQGVAPSRSLTARRAAGWSLFALGVAGMVTDAALYQLCYDGKRGPYFEQEGFRFTCSPVISVVTLDLSTLVGAAGLGLGLSAESQRKALGSFALAPWGGRGQAGLSFSGRF